MTEPGGLHFERLWEEATPYDRFVAAAQDLRGLWDGVYRTARIPAWAVERARAGGPAHLLIITEDWCWDAANTLPVIAKLADATGDIDLKVLERDEYPEVMDQYLTNGARSIPIVIALDTTFRELCHWGPRPTELQAWAMENKSRLPQKEFYAEMRRWLVRDKGESTLREVVELLQRR